MKSFRLPVGLAAGLLLSYSCASTPKPKSANKPAAQAQRPVQDKLLDQANQYARDGLYREALVSFQQYLDKNPSDGSANRTVGIIYVKTGSYKKAAQYLEKGFRAYPNNFELNFYMGEAMRMQSRYADAIYHYKRALESDSKNTATLKALAWSYYNIRYYSEGLRTARELRKLAPNDFQVAIIMARILNKISMNDKALAILNRSETLAPADAVPFLSSVKGDILLSMGEKAEAERAFRKALNDQPLLPGALVGLGRKLLEDKNPNHQAAITYLERAVKLRPSMVEAYYYLGKAHQKSNPGKSIAYFKIFAKEASFDPSFQAEIAEIRPQLLEAKKNKRNDLSSRDEADEFL